MKGGAGHVFLKKRQKGEPGKKLLTLGEKRGRLVVAIILVRREGKIMSTKTLPLTEVRDHFTSILRGVSDLYDRCVITKKGKPEAVLMSYEEFEGWLETLEIMSSPKAAKRIREARAEAKRGRVVSFEKAFGESL